MTIKKSLLALSTAGAVAIAGAGVASAQTADTAPAPTAGSAELSANRDVFGSITDANVLGSYTGDQISFAKSAAALAAIAGVGASIYGIATAYTAVTHASDAYQKTVNDTLGFLASKGIVLPN